MTESLPLGLRSLLTLLPALGVPSGSLLSGQPSAQPLSARPPVQVQPLPLSVSRLSVPLFCVHLFPISGAPSFCFLSFCSSLKGPLFFFPGLCWFVSVSPLSPSLVSRKLPKPAQDSAPPPSNTCHLSPSSPSSPPSPSTRGPSPQAPHHHSPWGATHPQQHNAQHQASRTLPIFGAPGSECQTFLRSCWAPREGGGRAGLSPTLPPAPGSPRPDWALPAWPSVVVGGCPSRARLSGPPSQLLCLLLSLPDFGQHFLRPWLPVASASAHYRLGAQGATWTSRG